MEEAKTDIVLFHSYAAYKQAKLIYGVRVVVTFGSKGKNSK